MKSQGISEQGPRAVILIAMLLFLGLALQFSPFFIDDSYITYRYADVWNRSGNLSFNVEDKDPVDGFTSLLWVMVSAVLLKLKVDPLLGTKILGVLSGLTGILLIYLIGVRLQLSRWLVAASLLMIGLSSETAMWANSGMETAFFSTILLAGVLLLLQDMDSLARPRSWAVFGALCLIRPEGIAFAGLSWLAFTTYKLFSADRTQAAKTSLQWLAGFAIIFGTYFVWHWSYYGYPFPNSYYAKAFPGEGLRYLQGFVIAYAPIFILSFISLAICIRERAYRRLTITALALGITITNLVAVWGIHPVMAWDHRLLLHLVPLLVVSSLPALQYALQSERPVARAGVLLCLVLAVVLTTRPDQYPDRIAGAKDSSQRIRGAHFKLGQWLRQHIDPGTVIGIIDTGVIPYLSRGRFVDIANVPLNNKRFVHGLEDIDAIWSLEPRAFILGGIDGNTIKHDRIRAPLVEEATRRGWTITSRLKYSDNYYVIVYMEPQLAGRISKELESAQADRATQEESTRPAGRWHQTPAKQSTDEKDPELEKLEEDLQALGYLGNTNVKAKAGGVVLHDRQRSFDGLNLYISGHGPEAHLVGMNGDVLHSWRYDFEDVWTEKSFPTGARMRGREYWRRAHLFENGDLIANFEYLGLIKIDKDSKLLWANPCRAHHDLDVDDNGDIYTLVRRDTSITWAGESMDAIVDDIVILNESGELRKRISLLDALERSSLSHLWHDRPEKKQDVLHTNAIRILNGHSRVPAFADGNLLLSMANIDAILVVSPNTRRVVWMYRGGFRAQHDPRMLADGRILLFDNKGTPGHSRILEIDPETNQSETAYIGSDENQFYTGTCGTSRRLGNGNILICESDRGRAFEVTSEGEVVWEFQNPHRAGKDLEYVATLFDLDRLPAGFPHDWAIASLPREQKQR